MASSTRRAATGARGGANGGRRARGSLSEVEILDGALALVAAGGLDGLSMPALARQVGSGVTSIYWYFRSKEELLEALAERVAADVQQQLPPLGEGPWHEVLVDHLLARRQLLEERRWYREVLARSYLVGPAAPAMFERPDAAAALVAAAGAPPPVAAEVVEVLAEFARGFMVLEHRLEGDDTPIERAEHLRHVATDDYPTLGALPDFIEVMWLDHEQLRFGLQLLVGGIRERHGL